MDANIAWARSIDQIKDYIVVEDSVTLEQAASELGRMYREALLRREQATSVHLFGIKFASRISGMSLAEITYRAGIPKAYATEIRKGINLARYVELRSENPDNYR